MRRQDSPKFKSKHRGKESFRLTGVIEVEPTRVKLPRIGWLRLKEHNYLPVGKPSQITISERAGRWFISFITTTDVKIPKITTGDTIGIDLGLHKLATVSNGQVFENPRSLKKRLKKLKRLQQTVSRRKKGSKNREKAKKAVANLHFKISNVRKDAIHKATSSIVKTKPSRVVMEDLAIRNMIQNRKLSRSIMDAALYEFRRQMGYKLDWIGSQLDLANRFYASSKLCCHCGAKKDDLTLADREYICGNCGCVEDRDFNASVNLSRYNTDSSSGFQDCGEGGSDVRTIPNVKLAS